MEVFIMVTTRMKLLMQCIATLRGANFATFHLCLSLTRLTNMYIEKNIPIPQRKGRGQSGPRAGISNILRSMDVGDSVFVECKESRQVSPIMRIISLETGFKFTQRKWQKENATGWTDGVRIWRRE